MAVFALTLDILPHVGASWPHLGPSWGLLGPTVRLSHLSALPVPMLRQVYVEGSWGPLGGSKVGILRGTSFKNGKMAMSTRCHYDFFSSRGHLRSSWGHLGRTWRHLRPTWTHLGLVLGPSWPDLGPRSVQKWLIFLRFFNIFTYSLSSR